jgi:hypothetical protein
MMSVSSKNPNLKSNAMPKQMHPNPRRTHIRLPPNRTSVSAIPAGSLDTYPMLAQTKPKLKPAQSALYKNKNFMALWQSSFADANQQKCTTRFIKTWMDDVCPTCLCEISFDHRCDPTDIVIAKHADSVRDTLRTTPLLDTIISAHAFERTGTKKPAPISMVPSFFLDAGGQDDTGNDSSQDESESYNSNRDEQESSDDDRSASSESSYQS